MFWTSAKIKRDVKSILNNTPKSLYMRGNCVELPKLYPLLAEAGFTEYNPEHVNWLKLEIVTRGYDYED